MTTPTAQRIAENVRVELARKGISQVDLATHIFGVYSAKTRNQTSRRVRGEVPFTADELAAVAEFIGVPVTDLLAAA